MIKKYVGANWKWRSLEKKVCDTLDHSIETKKKILVSKSKGANMEKNKWCRQCMSCSGKRCDVQIGLLGSNPYEETNPLRRSPAGAPLLTLGSRRCDRQQITPILNQFSLLRPGLELSLFCFHT